MLVTLALLVLPVVALVPPASPAQEMDRILSAVVGLRSEVPASARTAAGLGTRRAGSGVVIDANGLVLTIGYLVLEANLVFVPINRLKPILGELLTSGRGPGPLRPWLGMHSEELEGRVFVRRVSSGGPAEQAGVAPGAIITEINGQAVNSLSGLYRTLWSSGGPGARIRLTLLTADGNLDEREITAGNRYDFLEPSPR